MAKNEIEAKRDKQGLVETVIWAEETRPGVTGYSYSVHAVTANGERGKTLREERGQWNLPTLTRHLENLRGAYMAQWRMRAKAARTGERSEA